MLRSLVCVCALGFQFGLYVSTSFAQEDNFTVYKGATLIDGGAVRTNVSIVVRGEHILAIEPATKVSETGSKVVDVTGLYVTPGLIDSHVHLTTDLTREQSLSAMRRDLYSGITAERDMAGDTRELAELSRDALLGDLEGPDIYYAALMAGPSFFVDKRTHGAARGAVAGDVPWMKAVTFQTDLHLAVAEAHGSGATAIKIYADLPPELVAAITKEAHSQGMLVWAHATVYPTTASEVVAAGVDVVSHAPLLAVTHAPATYAASHLSPASDQQYVDAFGPQFTELLQEMKSRGTILDATLLIFKRMEAAKTSHPRTQSANLLTIGERVVQSAYKAGIPISTGTDLQDAVNKEWSPLLDELLVLQNVAGMKPGDVIRSATSIGARTFGRDNEMGMIKPGMLADMVFMDSNPLDGVEAFRTVELTVKRGKPYWRKDYTSPIASGDQNCPTNKLPAFLGAGRCAD